VSTSTFSCSRRTAHGRTSKLGRIAAGVGLALGLTGLTGCEVDSWFDPSVIGRWEATPTVMPILDRLASIEDDSGTYVQTSPIQPGDLVPYADEYRISAGDILEIRIRDFFEIRLEERFERVVDLTGFIDLPKLGAFRLEGKTPTEAREAIENAIAAADMQDNPIVAVTPLQLRRQTFSVLGAVAAPGQYYIPTRDYRLLEGITVAGGIAETIPTIYIIRQHSLADASPGRTEPTRTRDGWNEPRGAAPGAEPAGDDLMRLIDALSEPEAKPSPAVIGRRDSASPAAAGRAQPPIDIPDTGGNRPSTPTDTADQPSGTKSNWIFLNGQWTQVNGGAGVPEGADPLSGAGTAGEAQVVQRVIEVPTGPLLAGQADVNVVLRPSDVVRIPPSKSGLVYISGQVNRPGPYNLPGDGRLTLLRALTSAGGLGALAIPERVDLTRVVGKDRQATIRLNLRAIAEQTQPDIYLKPDDMINVGTNFFAYPIAIIRSGFRMSYGFGFILDRNFAGDIWGADLQQTGF
jgi:polysaccharide export outer membrane protein